MTRQFSSSSPADTQLVIGFSVIRSYVRGLIPVTLLAIVSVLTGCNQHRYQPAEWRAADRDSTTLPSSNRDTDAGLAGGSTLPWRGANSGSTLPWRGSTLPYRGSTLPWRGSTLPYRGTTLPGRNWTTLPFRGQDGDNWNNGGWNNGSTLPNRGRAMQYRSQTTLPSSSQRQQPTWSTLRHPGSTLPTRAYGSGNPLRDSRN